MAFVVCSFSLNCFSSFSFSSSSLSAHKFPADQHCCSFRAESSRLCSTSSPSTSCSSRWPTSRDYFPPASLRSRFFMSRSSRSEGSPRLGSQRASWLFASKSLHDFELDGKNPEINALERWRKSSLVLNGVRRFRYTADLESKRKISGLKQFRVGILAAEAARRFRVGIAHLDKYKEFSLTPRLLGEMVEDSQYEVLKSLNGPEGVATMLKSNPAEGILGSAEDITARQKLYGANKFEEKPPKSFLSFVFDAMQDITLMILFVCALVSIFVGIPTEGWNEGWYDGAGIAFSIFLVVFVTAISDYQQSLQFRQLDAEKKKIYIEVMRNKHRQKVLVSDLVVGDIVHLSIGDIVPGDGLFLHGHGLLIDESSMTGESVPVHKGKESPFLLAGTKVQDGSAVMVTTGVGMNTLWGKLMLTLSEAGDEETPLQVRLNGVATFIGQLGLYSAALVFVILMVRLGLSTPLADWGSEQFLQIVQFFAVAVSIVVVAVPEGLPLAVTLSLAYAMKRMMNDKALVRKLAACETMGSATTICSDKTGTLTTNKMIVVRAWLCGEMHDGDFRKLNIPLPLKSILLEGMFANTSGHVDERIEGNEIKMMILGSPTESAILGFGVELGGNFNHTCSNLEELITLPFNSQRKCMACVVRTSDGKVRVHWKGAPEVILGKCINALNCDGEHVALDRGNIDGVINFFASSALRTLSLAYRDLDPSEVPEGDYWPDSHPIPDNDLNLICIVGIKDPLRHNVSHSVNLCKTAGIKVRMVTGDNLITASAIAKECGILTDGGRVVEGPQFRHMNPAEMRELIPNLQVMARSSPLDKHILVKELRAMGEVVAVTGDGTNDAPALKEADIGLAMGIAGTEVAKDSADVVVLDDNFATIVTVAKWGRSVYINIQKFVQFQLTVNIVALTINFVSACVTGSAPLTAVQLLWVNLIMDTLGALALATEPPDDSLMNNPPVGRTGRLISNVMWRNITGQAIYQLAVLGVMQYKGISLLHLSGDDPDLLLTTMIFNSFVFCQLFNEVNSRQMTKINVLDGIFANRIFMAVVGSTVVFQWLLVQYLGKFATTTPLTLEQWAICIAIGFVSMPVAAIVKLIPVPKDPFFGNPELDVPSDPTGYVLLADEDGRP